MKTIPKALIGISLLVVFGISCLAGSSPDATPQIKGEIERLQQSVKDRSFTDPDLPDITKMLTEGLRGASEALTNGHSYLSLEMLGREWDLYSGALAAVDGKAEVVKGGLPSFETAWDQASVRVTSLGKSVKNTNWNRLPVAVQALAQSAVARTQPLLEGGRGFATATAPKDGLLYVGEAQGEAEFAKFCANLKLARRGSPFPLRSMLPELQALQVKTNAAFQPPRSIDSHSRFIALNSTIKLAGELDASRSFAASLYQYLEAVRHYGMLEAPALDSTKQVELKNATADLLGKIEASNQDDSIEQLFLERAASQVAHSDGSPPSSDEWRSAWVIVNQVLPAYAAAQKPALSVQQASGKTIDITLVRWPYT